MSPLRVACLVAACVLLWIIFIPVSGDAAIGTPPLHAGLTGGCEIVLFHSALGLRRGVLDWAEWLKSEGHRVSTPDFFEGTTSSNYEAAMRAVEERGGIPAYMQWTVKVGKDVPAGAVMMGFSNGADSAELLAATKPGVKGAVLMHGALPVKALSITEWPESVPVQVHYGNDDPFRYQEGVDGLREAVEAAGADFQFFSYSGTGHLFADPELPDFDPRSAELMKARVRSFLETLCHQD